MVAQSLTDAIGGGAKFITCKGAEAGGWVAQILASSGLPAETILRQIQGYQATKCGTDPANIIDTVTESPGFEGGQCEGVTYRYDADLMRDGTTFIGSPSISIVGPVESIHFEKRDDGWYFGGVGSLGEQTNNTMPISNPNYFRDLSIANIRIGARFPNGEECGDPPESLPPAIEEYEEPFTVDYEDEDGNPINWPDLPFKFFKPCIWLDGITIPFEVTTPLGFKICGKVGLRPDFANGLEPSVDLDVCPEEKQSLDDAREKGLEDFFEVGLPRGLGLSAPDGEFSGTANFNYDPENDKPVLGVLVETNRPDIQTFTQTSIANSPENTFPPLLIPRLGYVRFQTVVETEDGVEWSYSEPIDIKQVRSFVPCPWEFGAAQAEVTWVEPWGGTWREVRRKSCCEACASNDPRDDLPVVDRCRID